MYDVLLVDDEPLDLEAMQLLIPWDELNMKVAGTAYNGFAALELLRRQTVDILITDIQMPIMSGLELAEQAKSRNPSLKIIIISGHEEFQYARKAIAMNASSYILKPFDDRELIHALKNVKEQLHYERERYVKETHMEESLSLLQNEMVLSWIKGSLESPFIDTILNKYGIEWQSGQGCIALIEIDDLSQVLKQVSSEQQTSVIHHIHASITSHIRELRLGLFCRIEDNQIALFMSGLSSSPIEELQALVDAVKQDGIHTITVALGTLVPGFNVIPFSYRNAERLLAAKMFVGKSRVITAEQSEGEIVQQTSDLEKLFDGLFLATGKYDLVQIHDCLEDVFELVRKLGDKLSVYNFSMYVISKIETYLQTLNTNLLELLNIERKHMDVLFIFETIDDIKSWLRKKIYEISEHLHMKRKKPNRKLIGEIDAYMTDNLHRPLQLQEVARLFGFSTNYLGYLFREEMNVSFNEALISKRMEKARKLLQDPKLKIYEVAAQAGYQNLAFFSRHFKQSYGLTPGNYRKKS
ncbi:response regulator [Paenibacillus spongiae]|uniref:Response regulator n=1 Tax=Paenibacillus spongiae TaxID=2909671 RepID=A0ABY5S526_9BACL|nr:response regulator [Paenibacillus spongiae]UVI28789.1 response regulator [Paenibacillus spongiae]